MEKELYLTSLYDYYGCLLTDKQKEYFECYYFENLTMDEVADNYNISKNAISKSIKEVTDKLNYYEDNLHLYENNKKIKEILAESDYQKISELI